MIESNNIHKVYKQPSSELHVLKGISLMVKKGEVMAIVGPSGAGKSTLLHILGGLDKPNEGQVIIEDEDVYGLSERSRGRLRNKKIGFIFQFYHLLPEFTALENVILPGMIDANGSHWEDLKDKGLALLDRVGLKERPHHRPNELSGGEQQRVAIARALINEPQVILCDEPTGNLDSESGKEIINLLMEFNVKNSQTLIIVTHDEEIAVRSNRIVHIRDGRVIQ